MTTAPRPTVVLGFVGTKLDAGRTADRWLRWRPTVGLVAPGNPPVARIELLLNREADRAVARQVAADIAEVSPQTEVRVHLLDISGAWDFVEVYEALHEFVSGYDFRDSEDYLVHLATGTHVAQICLFLLTESRHIPGRLLGTRRAGAEDAACLGADTAVQPWWGHREVIDLALAHYDALAARFAKEQATHAELLKGGIVTRNAAFNALIEEVETVSLRSTAPILLTGPTGAGKGELAARIFALKQRKRQISGALVEVNCATLRGEGAMSALFGHKKGAFTGAVADRPGLLRQADKGLLFLDEVGELGLDEQAMLLRALEDRRFTPMGADKEVSADFQLIAGTNRDLWAQVGAGQFRLDLLQRLSVWSFDLPALAARREDIEPNLDYELARCGTELRLQVSMNAQARASFLDFALGYAWPGNFRELRACVLRMATLADGGRITPSDLEREVRRLRQSADATARLPGSGPCGKSLGPRLLGPRWDQLDLPERAELEAILEVVEDSRSLADAGRKLFAASRQGKANPNDSDRTRKTLARYGLTFEQVRAALG